MIVEAMRCNHLNCCFLLARMELMLGKMFVTSKINHFFYIFILFFMLFIRAT